MVPHRTVAVAVLALAAAGCYTWVPVQSPPEPGRSVRASVTQAGAEALRPRLGPGVLEVDGLLLERRDDQLSILLQEYVTRQAGTLSGNNEPIQLSWPQVDGVHERRIDVVRSGLFGAALVGGVVAAISIFGQEERVFETEVPDDPGAPQRRAPALDLRLLTRLLGGHSP